MEVLQGDINRDEYYSVRECAELLGVTTKTIRNRIEDKKLNAVWYDLGRGKSQWLILKADIQAIVESKDSKIPAPISLPPALLDEIKAHFNAQNEGLKAEINSLRGEVRAGQERLEKSLLERDEKLMQVIRERQHEKQEKAENPWWKIW